MRWVCILLTYQVQLEFFQMRLLVVDIDGEAHIHVVIYREKVMRWHLTNAFKYLQLLVCTRAVLSSFFDMAI